MYIYQDIAFRVIERDDLDVLRKLHNDPSTWENLLNIDFIDEEDQLEWWKGLHRKKNDKRFVICFSEKPHDVVGRLRMQNINWQHSNCEVGLDILPEHRRKGLGEKSYRMLLKFLFEQYNMNMVYLKVADFNPEARRLYEKIGFIKTGNLKDYFFRNGKFWDYHIYCMTRPNE